MDRSIRDRMADGSFYDDAYYLRGKETGRSLYENYRWLPHMTIPMVQSIIRHCGITSLHRVLDYGCARGYTVKAFRELGFNVKGIDCSQWAIDNADEVIKDRVWCGKELVQVYDWIIAKDVLEHVEGVADCVSHLMEHATTGVFVVVPLSDIDRISYVVPEYEKDQTHIHRLSLATWARMFMKPGWSVDARYRVVGVKDNYSGFETGNGFLTVRRL